MNVEVSRGARTEVRAYPPAAKHTATGDAESGAVADAGRLSGVLAAAIGALSSAAFVLAADGRLVEPNLAGQQWLSEDPAREELLREAVRGVAPAELVLTKVSDERDGFYLAHLATPSDRCADAALMWGWHFTRRERDVFALVVAGRTNRNIAATLAISARAVESEVQSILQKAGVMSRSELSALVEGLDSVGGAHNSRGAS